MLPRSLKGQAVAPKIKKACKSNIFTWKLNQANVVQLRNMGCFHTAFFFPTPTAMDLNSGFLRISLDFCQPSWFSLALLSFLPNLICYNLFWKIVSKASSEKCRREGVGFHGLFHITILNGMLPIAAPVSSETIQGWGFHTANFLALMSCLRSTMVISKKVWRDLP